MRKMFVFLLAMFLIANVAFAVSPAYKNSKNLDGFNDLGEPLSEVVRVRYGMTGADTTTIVSGTVVCWDTNSGDGVTVTALVTTTGVYQKVAGVLVTNLLTDDNGVMNVTDNWGYMCKRGYCLAYVDTSAAASGGTLTPSSIDGYFGTQGTTGTTTSQDSGTLLKDTGTDGLMPVYLN